METLFELFAEAAKRHPDETCITCENTDSEISLPLYTNANKTYSNDDQLDDRDRTSVTKTRPVSKECQNLTYLELLLLVHELGSVILTICKKNQILAVFLQEDFHAPAVFLSILRNGCAFFTISVDGLEYHSQALTKTGTRHIICHTQLKTHLTKLLQQRKWRENESEVFARHGLSLIELDIDISPSSSCEDNFNLAYCITTSGSTGAPKIVRVPHACIVPNITQLRAIWTLGPGDCVLLTSPLTFDPSIVDIFCTLTSGARLLIVSRQLKQSPSRLLEIVHDRHQVTVLQATPALLRRFSAKRLRETLLGVKQPLKVLALGGEPFPRGSELRTWLHPDNPTQFYNLYGITEVSCWASCQLVDRRELLKDTSPVPIGSPMDKTEVKIEAISRDNSSEGQGQILIGSAERVCIIDDEPGCRSRSYQKIVWRNTGDMGMRMKDGSIVCVGRTDSQIKRHGKRVSLVTIEEICKNLPWVWDSCAVYHRESLTLYVCLMGTTDVQTSSFKDGSHSYSLDSVQGGSKEKYDIDSGDDIRPVTQPSNHAATSAEKDFYSTDRSEKEKSGRNTSSKENGVERCVREHIRERLPSHYTPDHVVILTSPLPLTHHGKVNRQKLTEMANCVNVPAGVRDLDISPSLWMENIWKSYLQCGVKEIQSTNTFLSLGGDSLAAARLVEFLERTTDVSLPLLLDCVINKDFGHCVALLENYMTSGHSELLSRHTGPQRLNDEVCQTKTQSKCNMSQSELENVPRSALKRKDTNDELFRKRLDKKCANDKKIFRMSRIISDRDAFLPSQHYTKEILNNSVTQILGRGNQSFRICDSDSIQKLRHDPSQREHASPTLCTSEDKVRVLNSTEQIQPRVPLRENHSRNLKLRWKFDTKKCVDASPLVLLFGSQAVAYIGSHSGQFSGIDVQTGQAVWSVQLPDRIESSACASTDGTQLVLGCYDMSIYVLESLTGRQLWAFSTQDIVKCSPVVSPISTTDHVLCGSHDGWLYCLDLKHESCVWQHHMGGGSMFSSPVVDTLTGTVYASTLAGRLVALVETSGTEKWCVTLVKPVFASLALLDHSVLAASVDGTLYCVGHSGEMIWTFKTGASIFSAPVVKEDKIFLASHDHHVYCISTQGKLHWKFQADSTVYATVFVMEASTATSAKGHETVQFKFDGEIDREKASACVEQSMELSDDITEKTKEFVMGVMKDGSLDSVDLQKNIGTGWTCQQSQGGSVNSEMISIQNENRSGLTDQVNSLENDVKHCHSELNRNKTKHSKHLLSLPYESEADLTVTQPSTTNSRQDGACIHTTHINQRTVDMTPVNAHSSHKTQCNIDDAMFVSQSKATRIIEGTDSKQNTFHFTRGLSSTMVSSNSSSLNPESGIGVDYLLAASTCGSLYVINLSSGQAVSKTVLPGQVFSSPVAVGNRIVIGCRDNFVYCYELI